LAAISIVPVALTVKVLPEITPGPESTLKMTPRPELAEAEREKVLPDVGVAEIELIV
jgi:hypothetical protein